MLQLVEWLTLVTTLPSRNTAARMRLWRAVKALGAATLRDGVYLLPAREATSAALRALADEVRAADGSAEVLHIAADAAQDESFRQLFDRGTEYGALIAATHEATTDDKTLRRLTRELTQLAAADYFPGAAQDQARQALDDLAARLAPGEPRPAGGEIRRLASADFCGRTWATRKQLWVDRMASAWLIRRFIDREAKFLWLATPADCPADALGFDFDGAAFTHIAATGNAPERVSFEVLAASFGLDADPALARIGAIVHCLDLVNEGGAAVAEAAGIEAVLAGLRAAAPNDDQLLDAAGRVFDGLYKNYQQEGNDA
ncbi:MAG: chromate resistance protein [Gammaproteobacteria bacterium]|nr:chromate resistance protein [Gammaproteobacteria bacterium]MBU1646029.1 chromate resistance protein [Gammaproteobacteria bacterium]MBU1972091.1 chromate resistance protein [Gammaproteobacteria bacterium]